MTAPQTIYQIRAGVTSTVRIIHLSPSLRICQQQQGNRGVFRQYTAAVMDHRHSTDISAGTDDYKLCLHQHQEPLVNLAVHQPQTIICSIHLYRYFWYPTRLPRSKVSQRKTDTRKQTKKNCVNLRLFLSMK